MNIPNDKRISFDRAIELIHTAFRIWDDEYAISRYNEELWKEIQQASDMMEDALKYQQSYYDQLVDYKQITDNIG